MNFYWGASFLLVAGLVAITLRSFTRPNLELAVSRLASRLALPVREEVEPFVLRHAAARNRALALGGLTGAIVGIGIAPLLAHRIEQMVLVLIAVEVIGTTTALCVVSLRSIQPQQTPRVARAAAVGIGDYVAPAHRVLEGLVIAGAIGLFAVATRIRGLDLATCAALVLTILSFAVTEVASRRLVAQRQPADSDIELAWNDALRAQLVRDLYGTPIGFAVGTLILSVMQIGGSGLGVHVLPVLSLVLPVGLLVGTVVTQRLGLDRHVLRRLWPAQVKAGWY